MPLLFLPNYSDSVAALSSAAGVSVVSSAAGASASGGWAAAHAPAARAAGLAAVVLDRPGLAFDVDTPADLADYRKRSRSASRTRSAADPSPPAA